MSFSGSKNKFLILEKVWAGSAGIITRRHHSGEKCVGLSVSQDLWRFSERRSEESSLPVEWHQRRRQPAVFGVRPVPLLRLHVASHHVRGSAGRSHQRKHSKNPTDGSWTESDSDVSLWFSPTLIKSSSSSSSSSSVECHRVSVWGVSDGRGLLSVCWSASHHPGQHRSSSGLWEDPLQVLQVSQALPLAGTPVFCVCVW